MHCARRIHGSHNGRAVAPGLVTQIALLVIAFSTVGCYPFGTRVGEFHLKPKCSPLALRPIQAVPSLSRPDERSISAHAIFINGEGRAIEPHTDSCGREIRDSAYDRYLTTIIDSIRADSARRGTAPKLLLRIHGGLNTLNGSLDATVGMNEQISQDRQAGFYPLFINWESGLMSAYGEHLFLVRRGHRERGWWMVPALLTSPFYLVRDLGGAAARLPITTMTQAVMVNGKFWQNELPELVTPTAATLASIATGQALKASESDITSASSQALAHASVAESVVFRSYSGAVQSNVNNRQLLNSIPQDTAARTRQLLLAQTLRHGSEIAVGRFAYRRSKLEAATHIVTGLALALVPTRYFVMPPSRSKARSFHASYKSTNNRWVRAFRVAGWVPPKSIGLLFVDGLGTPAWDVMHRRTELMTRTEASFSQHQGKAGDYSLPDGALAVFLNKLSTLTANNPGYRMTIVGHSMGAIVAGRALMQADTLPIDNIVFLASAATLSEVQQQVYPYMRRQLNSAMPNRRRVQFYNITLHPWADERETNLFRVAPYGSLLAWIDGYFAHTETELDRASGRYENFLRTATTVPPDIRGSVHLKAFGYHSGKGCGKEDLPYKHGQFNERTVLFWRELFWHPGPATCEDVRLHPSPGGLDPAQ